MGEIELFEVVAPDRVLSMGEIELFEVVAPDRVLSMGEIELFDIRCYHLRLKWIRER